jgi:hypothetical protein
MVSSHSGDGRISPSAIAVNGAAGRALVVRQWWCCEFVPHGMRILTYRVELDSSNARICDIRVGISILAAAV